MSLLRSTFAFSTMTLVSRVLGLARDVVLASGFGASRSTDAFFVAFKIPNFLRRLFAEGSFSLAFVPVLSEYPEKHDHRALKSLIDATAGCLIAVLLVITAADVLAAPLLVAVFAPGFADEPEQQRLALKCPWVISAKQSPKVKASLTRQLGKCDHPDVGSNFSRNIDRDCQKSEHKCTDKQRNRKG